tara:strand:- start:360 stop:698 length:339 start_codon:yes stop_codon:yes gene_type:complete
MIITEERKQFYKEIGVNINQLKPYYINRAKLLLKYYNQYNDNYANKMKTVLTLFIKNPIKELKDIIEDVKIKSKIDYNSFEINNTLFDIYYVDAELIEFYLKEGPITLQESF